MCELEERYMFGVGRGYKCMSWKRDTCLVWGGGYKCTSLKENEYTASKTSTWLEYPCVCVQEKLCVYANHMQILPHHHTHYIYIKYVLRFIML